MNREMVSALVALVVLIGGFSLMAFAPNANVPREAIFGLMTLIVGFYFGNSNNGGSAASSRGTPPDNARSVK